VAATTDPPRARKSVCRTVEVAEVIAWFQRWARSVENGTGALRGGPMRDDGAGGVVGSNELSSRREE
jgi:hypothetical protein